MLKIILLFIALTLALIPSFTLLRSFLKIASKPKSEVCYLDMPLKNKPQIDTSEIRPSYSYDNPTDFVPVNVSAIAEMSGGTISIRLFSPIL
jgi:hypothetical protein